MRKKKLWEGKSYSLEVTTKEGDTILRTTYRGYKTIRFRYDKRNKTLRAVLIRYSGNKRVIEKINVESVEKYQE